jgi:transposase
MLAKIRRMHIREKLSIREIARRTNLSRNTVRQWLKSLEMSEPKYPKRRVVSVVDPYSDQLRSWLETDSHRPKRDRRTAKIMIEPIRARCAAVAPPIQTLIDGKEAWHDKITTLNN